MAALQAWCRQQLGCAIEVRETAQTLRHSFTHFHLHITPLHARVTGEEDTLMEGGKYLWYNVAQLQEQALATPVKHILQGLRTTENS